MALPALLRGKHSTSSVPNMSDEAKQVLTEIRAKADKTAPPYWLPDIQTFTAVTLVGLYATTIMLLILKPITITGEAGTLLTALTGLLTGKVATIVDFYFGTSKSSASKDEAAKTQAQTISDLAAPEKVTVTASSAGGHNTGEVK